MSASYLVDLGATTQLQNSISPANGVGSTPASGVIIGAVVDLLNANSFTNVQVHGGPASGPFQVQVQVSDLTTSGSFGDPTSGMTQFPQGVLSGGLAWVNSGLWVSGTFGLPYGGVVNNAPLFCSGNVQAFGFVRTGRYARVNVLSGSAFVAPVTAGFVAQLKTTSSGGGYTLAPGSGSVSV